MGELKHEILTVDTSDLFHMAVRAALIAGMAGTMMDGMLAAATAAVWSLLAALDLYRWWRVRGRLRALQDRIAAEGGRAS